MMTMQPGGASNDASVDMIGLADTLWRRRWLVLGAMVVVVAVAAVGLFMIHSRYTATSRILIDPREQRVVQNELVQQGLGTDMALVDSQVEVITSEAVLSRVVEDMDLVSDPEFVPASSSDRKPSEVALENLAKATEVKRPENTYVLEISVTTKEAAKSARLANAVAHAYTADQAASTANAARDVSSSIRDRLNQLQQQLQDAEEKVEAYKREHNVSESDGQLLVDRRVADLSERHSAAVANAAQAKARLDVMEQALKSRGDVSSVVTDPNGSMASLRAQLSDARRRLAELEQVLGPLHPRVSAARGQVGEAQAAIRAESRRLVADARDDYQTASDTADELAAELKRTQSQSFDTNQDLIRLRELQREAQSSRVVYETFLVRAKETAEQETITARTARIIAPASVPDSPSFPPRLPLLAAAVVLGLGFGILLALLADLFARARTRRVAEPEAAAGAAAAADLPAAGTVMVTTLGEPAQSRQAAIEMARDGVSETRSIMFLDLAADADPEVPGLAEMISGEMSATDVVRIGKKSGLHMLNAGRRDAVAAITRDRLERVLDAICEEYDDVVANLGAVTDEMGMFAETFAARASHAVLVIAGDEPDEREKRAMSELAAGGDRTVSMVSLDGDGSLDQAA